MARPWGHCDGSEVSSEEDEKQAEDLYRWDRTGGQGQKQGDLRGGWKMQVVQAGKAVVGKLEAVKSWK